MTNKRTAAADARRRLVEFHEHLYDRSEIYDEERARLLTAGDALGAERHMEEFASWRRDYLAHGEAEGLYRGGVMLGTNHWFDWGCIAFRAETAALTAAARFEATFGSADPDDALGVSYRESMAAIVAAAFMIDSLYGSICYLLADAGGNRRWSRILRTCRALFDLSRIPRLDQRVQELFHLRDDAAHPWVAVKVPQPHPSGLTNIAPELATYTPATATQSIDLSLTLIEHCIHFPQSGNRRAARWATNNLASYESLIKRRSPPTSF